MTPPVSLLGRSWPAALWAFSRPHTIWGTLLSVTSLAVLACVLPTPRDAVAGPLGVVAVVVAALLPALAANVFIVGLNQITDVAIDRINKPHLPLASGRFSRHQAWVIVIASGVLALLLAALQGAVLGATVAGAMAIGTAYSCPPLRLKRFPFWAALCIVGVRGVVVNVGFFAHFFRALGGTGFVLPPEVLALSAFVMIFSLAIALFKDIPDQRGDRRHRIRTLTVRLGEARVFRLCCVILTVSYGLMIVLAASGSLPSLNRSVLIVGQVLALLLLWIRSRGMNVRHIEQTRAFYQLIWKLFFLEYLIFPAAALAA